MSANLTPYYESNGITLYHGDARVVLPQLSPVDVVYTDPVWPGAHITPRLEGWERPEDLFAEVVGYHCKRLAATGRLMVQLGDTTNPGMLGYLGAHGEFLRVCWLRYPQSRRRGTVMSRADLLYIYGPGWLSDDPQAACRNLTGEIIEKPHEMTSGGPVEKIDHPCPRNLKHVEWAFRNYTKLGMTILDPFVGSGTTLLAALHTGRQAVGVEVEERYCEVAARRVEAALRQQTLPLENVS